MSDNTKSNSYELWAYAHPLMERLLAWFGVLVVVVVYWYCVVRSALAAIW